MERLYMKFPPTRSPRLLAALALTAAASLTLTACGGSAEPGTSSDAGGGGDVAVTLITKDNNNPFFVAMQAGAKESGTQNGVSITTAAGAKDGDEDGQVKAIEAAVARGDKGILITPNGPGVNSALDSARQAGLYVIALDTPPDPADTADITFATDNFKAGVLIGEWTAAKLDGKTANIALLDLHNDKIVSVDYNRDQGFLTGMGIDVKDKMKNGDEDKTGSYSGGDYTIVCNEPTSGAQDEGKSAMENCLSKTKDINVVYTINEPAAAGAAEAIEAAGLEDVILVSVDGGCSPGLELVADGTVSATSQQYPLKMAQLGVEAIKKIADGGEAPAVTEGLTFYDTGVSLVAGEPMEGVDSISVEEGQELCWG
ncbi:sugar ABC transporter substrate-binding protein [Microlunatus lacustris]